MIQYYRTIDKLGDKLIIETWRGDNSRIGWLLKAKSQVLPLGTTKPKTVPHETIKEF